MEKLKLLMLFYGMFLVVCGVIVLFVSLCKCCHSEKDSYSALTEDGKDKLPLEESVEYEPAVARHHLKQQAEKTILCKKRERPKSRKRVRFASVARYRVIPPREKGDFPSSD